MGITTTVAAKVAGGVLRRTVQTMLGTAACTTTVAMQAEATSVRYLGCLLGASGIKQYDVDPLTI